MSNRKIWTLILIAIIAVISSWLAQNLRDYWRYRGSVKISYSDFLTLINKNQNFEVEIKSSPSGYDLVAINGKQKLKCFTSDKDLFSRILGYNKNVSEEPSDPPIPILQIIYQSVVFLIVFVGGYWFVLDAINKRRESGFYK